MSRVEAFATNQVIKALESRLVTENQKIKNVRLQFDFDL